MSQRIVIVGAGGMGRCVLDVIDAVNAAQDTAKVEPVGVLDDLWNGDPQFGRRGVPYLGGTDALADLTTDVAYVLAVSSPRARARIDRIGLESGLDSAVLVHPNAHLGYDVRLGPGAVICSHVSIENNVRMGRHVHVNQNSTVGHDCRLGGYVTVSPLVALSGAVTVHDEVFIGTGSSIRQGVQLGHAAIVGMGAAVVGDVDALTTVVGVPARPVSR